MGKNRFFQRRRFLQGAASLLLGGTLPSAPTPVAAKAGGLAGEPLTTLIDVDACDGCGACVRACRDRNLEGVPLPVRQPPQPYPSWIRIQDWSGKRDVTDRLTPYNWLYLQSCTVQTEDGARKVFLPRRCMHCINPPCANLCSTGAARQRANGAVYIDHRSCMGDGQCDRACPWMIPRRQSGVGPYLSFAPRYVGNGQMFKCDYCQDLLAEGKPPACIAACPSQAQRIGPREDMVRAARTMAEERKGDIFGLNENGGTNTLYVSSLAFRDMEAGLLREDQIGYGRPSLRPAGASMDKENRLLGTVLLAPLAGAALAWLRIWREKQKRRRP